MPGGGQPNLTSSLGDLERKLVELERELGAYAGGGAPPAAPAAATAPAAGSAATLRVEDLRGQIADLARFRDQLAAAAGDLVSEYDRLVGSIPAETPPAQEAVPRGSAHDTVSFVGAVVVDAGPFTDIATLSTFQRGLSRITGAQDVVVRSFDGDRALLEVRLLNPFPLVERLREQLPWPITPVQASDGRLVVNVVVAGAHGA